MADRTDTPTLTTPTTDRRAFFTAAALLGVASVLPGTPSAAGATVIAPATAPATEDDDGEGYTEADLIAFCAEWRVATDEHIPLVTYLGGFFEKDQPVAERARCDALDDDVAELEEIIFTTPATTLAGVQAKAGVLAYMAEAMDLPPLPEQAASLIADILALRGAA